MTTVDARGIARVAQNPDCQLQAAMILLGTPENVFYELYVDLPYPGEDGPRTAALRWGRRFEHHLTEHGARRLLAALDGLLGMRASTATVRDLRQEVPGTSKTAMAERAWRTSAILADLLAERPVPDLLLQPPLRLRRGLSEWGCIVPDALVLDRARGTYLPLEIKGHISVEGTIARGERALVRLQATVQVTALASELDLLRHASRIVPAAILVFAAPFSLRPAPPMLEQLAAEVTVMDAALVTLERVEVALYGSRDRVRSLLAALDRLPIHFQETCLTTCVLAEVCRKRAPGIRGALGDRAAAIVGEVVDLPRIEALVAGEPPATAAASHLLAGLHDAATIFGWDR